MKTSARNSTPTLTEFSIFNTPRPKRSKPDEHEEVEEEAARNPIEAILQQMKLNQTETRETLVGMSQKIDNFHQDVTTKIEAIGTRVGSLEATVEKTSTDMNSLQQRMSDIEQEKLASHMIINGAAATEVDANTGNIRNFTVSLIQSFNIPISLAEIENAFAFPIQTNQRRIVVMFRSAETKMKVMKDKRASNDSRKIYFDHRVTAQIGELLRQSRAYAKTNGGKAFLYSGRVYYQKEPNQKMRIDTLNDIEKLKPPPQ